MIYFHSYKNPGLVIDIVSDIRRINDIALKAKRAGMIILGGGVCKHQIANAMLFVRLNSTFTIWYCIDNQNYSGTERTTRCISILARSLTDRTLGRDPMRRFRGGRYELVPRLLRYITTIHVRGVAEYPTRSLQMPRLYFLCSSQQPLLTENHQRTKVFLL